MLNAGYAAAVEHADAERVAELDRYLHTPDDAIAEQNSRDRLAALLDAGGEIA